MGKVDKCYYEFFIKHLFVLYNPRKTPTPTFIVYRTVNLIKLHYAGLLNRARFDLIYILYERLILNIERGIFSNKLH